MRTETVALRRAFNLFPRPVVVMTTVHHASPEQGVRNESIARMLGDSYHPRADYNAAPMSTFTLLGKRPKGHKGPYEEGGPPVYSVAITPSRRTFRNLMKFGETVVNVIPPVQEVLDMMYVCSDGSFSSGNAKILASGFTLETSEGVSVPRIVEATAWIECRVNELVMIARSERPIFTLEPLSAYTREGYLDPETSTYLDPGVITYQLASNIFTGPRNEVMVGRARHRGIMEPIPPELHWAYSDGLLLPWEPGCPGKASEKIHIREDEAR